jgi:hypothetical protein
LRRFLILVAVVSLFIFGAVGCSLSNSASASKDAAIIIRKEPVMFSQRSFDAVGPPADMPPLGEGEEAECDSNFVSNVSVTGEPHRIDSTNAVVTVSHVKITLQLRITVWVPNNATQHVIDHEQGHRLISEHYYESAGQVARQIAASYLGRQVSVSSSDLSAETSKALLRLSSEITAEYNDKLRPDPAQQRYDDLTDHSRNDVSSATAVAQALKETIAP